MCLSLCHYHTVLVTAGLISFEMRKYESSTFVPFSFFKIVLVIPDPLRFPINFKMGFSISAKKPNIYSITAILLNINCLYISLNLKDAAQFQEGNAQILDQNRSASRLYHRYNLHCLIQPPAITVTHLQASSCLSPRD